MKRHAAKHIPAARRVAAISAALAFLLTAHHAAGQGKLAPKGHAASPVRVSKVTFKQGTTLTNDDGSAMPTPQWIDERSNSNPNESPPFPDGSPDPDPDKPTPNNVKSYAYSYVSNKRPMVGAEFRWRNGAPPDGSPYSAEGKVVNTPNCGFTLKRNTLIGDTVYPDTVTAEADNIVKERRIQAYVTGNRKVPRSDGTKDQSQDLVPVTIEWTVFDKAGKAVGTSQSTHTIYVTWDEPSTPLRQETLFNLSCVMANGMQSNTGATTADEALRWNIIVKTWDEFKDKSVLRMSGNPITYWMHQAAYNNNSSAGMDSPYLLKQGDGRCQGWAELFRDVFLVNSIADLKQADIYPYPPMYTDPSGNLAAVAKDLIIKPANIAQGPTKIPKNDFLNHAVMVWKCPFPKLSKESLLSQQALIGAKVFDPSYGIYVNSNREWEIHSLAGVKYQRIDGAVMTRPQSDKDQDTTFSNP